MDTTNTPQAWLEPATGTIMPDTDYQNNPFAHETGDWIPLYTHPNKHDLGIAEATGFDRGYQAARLGTLTDEEIEQVWIQALQDEPKANVGKFPALTNQPFVFFARALLRRAGEK